jgi:DNA repair exonuclease SbcCD ATPase subunit
MKRFARQLPWIILVALPLARASVTAPVPEPVAAPQATPTAAPTVAADSPIARQQKRVDELQKRADEAKRALDQLDAQAATSQGSGVNTDQLAAAVQEARSNLAALESQRSAAQEQEQRSREEQNQREQAKRLESELAAANLRQQLAFEQSKAQAMQAQLDQLRAANLSTDLLAQMEEEVPAQWQRVASLQAQYDEVVARAGTVEPPQLPAVDVTVLDDQIRQWTAELQRREKDYDEAARRQQEGQAAEQKNEAQYTDRKREYDELLHELDVQRAVLASEVASRPVP